MLLHRSSRTASEFTLGYSDLRGLLQSTRAMRATIGATLKRISIVEGIFKGWQKNEDFGFIQNPDGEGDVFIHANDLSDSKEIKAGDTICFGVIKTPRGRKAVNARPLPSHVASESNVDSEQNAFLNDDVEELDASSVDRSTLEEISAWKREAKAEDSQRYFWHVNEVDMISKGRKYFVIGRKGSGKTAICEHFNRQRAHNVFAEKLTFKQFPFNELYSRTNTSYTVPNQYITLWKYLIYSTICRLMLRNEAVDGELRTKLSALFGDSISLSRRVKKWVAKEFGLSLFGLSFKVSNNSPASAPHDWIDYVDYTEDLLKQYAGDATYYVLFDELDEDYRDVINADQYNQYTALITSLFKAVQDIRTIFNDNSGAKIYPVVFLRDDIYEIVQDSDKNKWGDFRVDLFWDSEKIKRLIAFRISRALNRECVDILSFDDAWARVFGRTKINRGHENKRRVSTFDYIAASTLLRPRDFVAYLQNCAEHALQTEGAGVISPRIVKIVDKAFSNYLREELTDELFAILPDIVNIFDVLSQLRKWNFSISEFEKAYLQQVGRGFIKEKNVKFVLQVLFMFDVIGNAPGRNRVVFRYVNREARLNFNERVVVHRGLFKALQII